MGRSHTLPGDRRRVAGQGGVSDPPTLCEKLSVSSKLTRKRIYRTTLQRIPQESSSWLALSTFTARPGFDP